MIRTGMIGVYR